MRTTLYLIIRQVSSTNLDQKSRKLTACQCEYIFDHALLQSETGLRSIYEKYSPNAPPTYGGEFMHWAELDVFYSYSMLHKNIQSTCRYLCRNKKKRLKFNAYSHRRKYTARLARIRLRPDSVFNRLLIFLLTPPLQCQNYFPIVTKVGSINEVDQSIDLAFHIFNRNEHFIDKKCCMSCIHIKSILISIRIFSGFNSFFGSNGSGLNWNVLFN